MTFEPIGDVATRIVERVAQERSMAQAAEKSETVEHPLAPAQGSALTPMDMVRHAVLQGANIDVLEKLIALQERWEATQARRAFEEAVAEAKSKIEVIQKNRKGHNMKLYADFAAIARAVDPVLGPLGLSYRFRTHQDERIHVTCILRHKGGHHEENTLVGPSDTTGNKNAIQAIGSTLSYLQRYSLIQALGLAAAEDDDGKAAGAGGLVSEEQVAAIQALIVETGSDIKRFCKYIAKVETVEDIPAKDFDRAIAALESKRKKEEPVQ